MTNREFYTAIVNANINDEITAHATAAIEKLDNALEARKNKPSKKATENAPILASITEILTDTPMIASDVATAVGISTQKASALLRQLVASGVATVSEVKVPKKGAVKAYALATGETADAE